MAKKSAEKFAEIIKDRMNLPTSMCYIEPDYIYNIKTGERLAQSAAITAMCAIGQPQQFFDFLKGRYVIDKIAFDDHHQYSPIDLIDIKKGSIVTTEKDAVKLLRFDKDNIYALKLRTRLDVEGLLK